MAETPMKEKAVSCMGPSVRCSRDKYQSSKCTLMLTHSWQNIVGYIYIYIL